MPILTPSSLSPTTSVEHQIYLMIQVIAARLRDDTDRLLKPAGLTLAQFNILRILRGAGSTSLTCSAISAQLITRDADVTRMLDRLEALGLVERARSEHDRRVVLTRISEKALALIATLDEPLASLHAQQFAHLAPERLRDLLGLLDEAAR
ncbi:MarR family transcriptional regulator (plasmid) [Deinococcus radiomollis]|uniref:MarR family winged helix-turn-helix transcriptional regulator n=1 Tax=Deinococcus radiomollis TaxID=468916 RepID=UPI00389123B7